MKRLLGLLAIVTAVFYPALAGEFLYWDDYTHIVNNPALTSGDIFYFWREPWYGLYIPVIYSLWASINAISSQALAFHILNIVLHSFNGWLVYRLLELSLPETKVRPHLLWLGTLAFLVHPLQAESAVWISGARDLLAASFGFSAILILWQSESKKSYAFATLLFVFGLLSKALLAPFPVAMAALFPFRQKLNRPRIVTIGIWVVCSVVILLINKKVQQDLTEAMLTSVSLIERFLIAGDSLGFYISKFFVPYPLAPDYGRIPELVIAKQWWLWPSIIFVAALITITIARFRNMKLIWEGWIYFGLVLGPVLGLIPFMAQAQSTVADRYAYMALFGPILGFTWLAARSAKFTAVFATFIAVWAVMSFSHSKMWSNNDVLFGAMLAYNPDSYVGHTTIGVVEFGAGRFDKAEYHFREAHRIQPMLVSPVGNLAVLYWQLKRYDRLHSETEVLFNNPEFIKANMTVKPSLSRMGRIVARMQQLQGRMADANRSWCLAYMLDPLNQDGVHEFMALQGVTGLKCPPP